MSREAAFFYNVIFKCYQIFDRAHFIEGNGYEKKIKKIQLPCHLKASVTKLSDS